MRSNHLTKRMKSTLLATILLFSLTGCARKPSIDIQADLERKFQQTTSGVTLVGHSTSLKGESIAGEEKLGSFRFVFNTVPMTSQYRCR
jgi:predicted small lipoprotein YifL